MTMLTLPFSPLIPYNTVPLLFRLYPGGIIAINLTLDWLSSMAGQDGTTFVSSLPFVPANARHHVQKESVMEQKTSLFSRRTTARRRRRDPKYKRQTANLGLREITENERGCLRKREWIFNESFSLFFSIRRKQNNTKMPQRERANGNQTRKRPSPCDTFNG